MDRLRLRRGIAARASIASAAAAAALLLLPVPHASAQAAVQADPAACPAPSGVRIRAATYVALGKDLLFRLLVERSVDDALLLMNKVDGNRLYDRTYWKAVKVGENCGQRVIDYVDDDAPQVAGAQTMRLVLEPAEEVRRPGLPRPLVIFAASVVLPSGERQALQFEEVVIKREVGAK